MAWAGRSAHERRALRRLLPALQHLVNWLDALLRALQSRKVVDLMAVKPVTHADLHLVEAVEHIELRERDAVDAGGPRWSA